MPNSATVHMVDPTNSIAIAACGNGPTFGLNLDPTCPIGGFATPITGTSIPREVTCKRCLHLLGREPLAS